MALFLGVLKGFDKNECPARLDIMKTFITTLSLCLATSLFAGDKEAELKKRIAGYDASIASARKNLSDLYAKRGALRKDDLAIKRKKSRNRQTPHHSRSQEKATGEEAH